MKQVPSSFATICTKDCKQELVGLLLSLSIHHPDSKVYIMCDSETKRNYDSMSFKPKLITKWYETLNEYTDYNRAEMERMNIFNKFLESKTYIMDEALKYEEDCLFLDSDIIVTHYINDIDKTKKLGVSPGFVRNDIGKKFGFYNAGMIWINSKDIPSQWRKYNQTSRYFEQASIEDLYDHYKKDDDVFIFEDNYNLQTWRFVVGEESGQKIASYIKPDPNNNMIWYKNKPLKFIHTHFNKPQFEKLNDFLIQKMMEAKMYRELLCIYRCKFNKWIISLPKQPMNGLGSHNNDSFREIPILLKSKYKDIDIKLDEKSIHCKLFPNIILYDRPTLQWIDHEVLESSLFLLGNGNINVEGKMLKVKINNINIKPWIFWPRKPMLVEKILKKQGILTYDERTIESIFIGNFENNVQKKYRQDGINWDSVLDDYHCTAGNKYLFSHEEYLMKLRESKYGLCLRGYGSKCHREVELMAFGTVPIITPDVCISSYMDPPKENVHYIFVNSPNELENKINKISQEQWENMSKNCYDWYQKNVISDNMWQNMIEYIFIDKKI